MTANVKEVSGSKLIEVSLEDFQRLVNEVAELKTALGEIVIPEQKQYMVVPDYSARTVLVDDTNKTFFAEVPQGASDITAYGQPHTMQNNGFIYPNINVVTPDKPTAEFLGTARVWINGIDVYRNLDGIYSINPAIQRSLSNVVFPVKKGDTVYVSISVSTAPARLAWFGAIFFFPPQIVEL